MMKLLSLALVASLSVPAAAAPDNAAGHAAAAKPEKRERLICKREATIGSLVKKKRTCLTAEGWKQAQFMHDQNVKQWRDAIDSKQRAN
jgi:hypothetical protein